MTKPDPGRMVTHYVGDSCPDGHREAGGEGMKTQEFDYPASIRRLAEAEWECPDCGGKGFTHNLHNDDGSPIPSGDCPICRDSKRKETHMAINEANMARERTRRETIDGMLLKVGNLARENDQAVLRLRGMLVGALGEEQRPERPVRPGWLGEITDALEVVIEHLDGTAKVLEEVSQQVATQTPTGIAPRR